ncbi:MAG: P-loop containing nucleoside triphosphate hydrolase protein [Olpidium bornovanus]|uniref:P-loop containing nucleoside triphosphate hydrolase protein n=1 Tax=Olpidium bornovanus TaxID=278681 RepID=A0A8H7ZRG0_9FUNG|nr:MAG: P-loop containing nucleoside triphosphate hydrolase protein [Olpidium bornovanus]
MQLRKVCNHPLLFEQEYEINEELTTSSGKMLLLDRMLPALLERNHRVLIFSQMTSMLDILEEWCVPLRDWPVFRIDGNVSQPERRRQMELFNKQRPDKSSEKDVKIFLLSTRAGGLGINLTAADTVIIFDSDWVSSLLSELLLPTFNDPALHSAGVAASIAAELAEILATEDQERANSNGHSLSSPTFTTAAGFTNASLEPRQILSDEDLERLLDRNPAAYEATEAVLKSGAASELGAPKSKAGFYETSRAFRVIEHVSDEMADALATKP